MSVYWQSLMVVTCDVCGTQRSLWAETKDRAREFLLWNEQWAHDKKKNFDQCAKCSKEPRVVSPPTQPPSSESGMDQ